MTPRPGILSGVLRLTAVVAALGSATVLLWGKPADLVGVPPDTALTDAPAQVAEDQTAAGVWSFRAGGWYIRVDGVQVDPPIQARPPVRHPAVSSVAATSRLDQAAALSPFDQLIVHHAKAEGFDWRLVAALIFEESRFNPTSESDKGAYGLMQVRPIAAHAVGTDRFRAPDDNISAGVRYLRHLDGKFRDAKERDRIGLVLAAYNMGPGHVQDAQMLARRFGFDPNRWEGHIDRILPLLELPSIYTKLPNGFAKGRDTVAYVHRTIERYHLYQRQRPGTPAMDAGALLSPVEGAPANG
jgi:soluble lytic murein transglycosylase-like protein